MYVSTMYVYVNTVILYGLRISVAPKIYGLSGRDPKKRFASGHKAWLYTIIYHSILYWSIFTLCIYYELNRCVLFFVLFVLFLSSSVFFVMFFSLLIMESFFRWSWLWKMSGVDRFALNRADVIWPNLREVTMNLLEVSQVSAFSYNFFFLIFPLVAHSTRNQSKHWQNNCMEKGEGAGRTGGEENANTDNDRQRRQLPQP